MQFVRIDLDADEDEQQIFDTINSLGVNLTTSELLKNYFFNRETVGEYERKWADVFEKDDETKVYWDREIETGNLREVLYRAEEKGFAFLSADESEQGIRLALSCAAVPVEKFSEALQLLKQCF